MQGVSCCLQGALGTQMHGVDSQAGGVAFGSLCALVWGYEHRVPSGACVMRSEGRLAP